MPPKKRKTGRGKSATASAAQPHFMWLLEYKCDGRYGEPDDIKVRLYSTKEKAMEAFPNLMSVNSPWGEDWKYGLEGYGAEDMEEYLGFECSAASVRATTGGGVLLTNVNHEENETITMSVKRMQVDPPDQPATITLDTDTEDEISEIAY